MKLKPEDLGVGVGVGVGVVGKPKTDTPVKLEHLGATGLAKAMTSVRVSHCLQVTC